MRSPCSASRRRSGCDSADRLSPARSFPVARPPRLMTVLVVGSVALDSVETPFGRADDALGGSATYFAASASHHTPVQLVGVVGNDYPMDKLRVLEARGVDLSGLEQADGSRSAGADAIAMTSTLLRRSKPASACSHISGRRSPRSSNGPSTFSSATSIRACRSKC